MLLWVVDLMMIGHVGVRELDAVALGRLWIMGTLVFAMGVVMVTFIIGGGVATRVIPSWIHALLFGAAILVQIRSLVLEGQVLMANDRLMRQVDQAVGTG